MGAAAGDRKSSFNPRQIALTTTYHFDRSRSGKPVQPPEPDIRFTGLKCRMEHFVSGMNVAVVVAVEYPQPGLTVVTVIDITKG